MKDKNLLTIEELCERWHVSKSEIIAWQTQGKFWEPNVFFDGQKYFLRREIELKEQQFLKIGFEKCIV